MVRLLEAFLISSAEHWIDSLLKSGVKIEGTDNLSVDSFFRF